MATTKKYVLRIETANEKRAKVYGTTVATFEFPTAEAARQAISLHEVTETPVSLGVEELLATVEPGRCTA